MTALPHYLLEFSLSSKFILSDTLLTKADSFMSRFVCEERLPIDIALLCNLVEQLCASYVIAYRMQKNTSLHDLTLSRKWLLKLSTEEKLQNQDINLLQMLVNLIPILLEETYTTVYITKSCK